MLTARGETVSRFLNSISNFFGMETTPDFHLHDDSKSLPDVEALRPSSHLNHFDDIASHLDQPPPEPTIQNKYYSQFKKIYETSYRLWTECRKQRKSKENLTARIATIEAQLTALHKVRRIEEEVEPSEECQLENRAGKRTRRTAEEIERKFNCRADYCGRCYGSEGSLQQHIKLKHPQLYKKEPHIDSQEY